MYYIRSSDLTHPYQSLPISPSPAPDNHYSNLQRFDFFLLGSTYKWYHVVFVFGLFHLV